MTDRVTVYDRAGAPLAELSATVTRAWQLRRDYEGARGELNISIADPKCRPDYLRLRNFILVESDEVQDWIGILWLPRIWEEGILTYQLFSAEHLFTFRRTNINDELIGDGGAIFTQLLAIANSSEATGIAFKADEIDHSGESISRSYHRDDTMEAMNVLARDLNSYWWVYPQVVSGKLNMYAKWQPERGSFFPTRLQDGKNFANIVLSEEGAVANRLFVWKESDDWSNPVEAQAQDLDSIADYGLIEDGFASMNTDDLSSLQALANSHLTQRKEHRYVITGDIIEPPFPSVGDWVSVHLFSRGFLGMSGVGGVLQSRVRLATYSSNEGVMSVTLRKVEEEMEE